MLDSLAATTASDLIPLTGPVTFRAYLLRARERIAEGAVGAVLTRERLEDLYRAPVQKLTDATTGHAAFLPG